MSTTTDSFLTLADALAAELRRRAPDANRAAALPAADVAALTGSGYTALTVPTAHGGPGLALADTVRAHLRLSQGSPSTAVVAAMPLHLFGHARETQPWSPAHMAAFSRAAVHEQALFNAVASEPALGSPSRGQLFQTTARLSADGTHYCLNGHKTWVTGGRHLTHLLVKADLDGDAAVLLVEGDRPGLRWEETWRHALSLRASDSHDLFLEDVRVPTANLVARSRPDAPSPPNVWFPMLMAATYLGAALAARDAVIGHALARVPTALGRPIATLPAIQRQIGALDAALQAAAALLLDVARAWDRLQPAAPAARAAFMARVAAAKHVAVETALRVTDDALRIAGGAALTDGLPLEQYFRDVRAGLMQPPAGDAALEQIGRQAIADGAARRPA